MPARKDDVQPGQRFGYGVVIRESRRGNLRAFVMRCDCGALYESVRASLVNGSTRSCGCYRRNKIRDRNTTHNLARHPLYGTWTHMRDRCYNPADKGYVNYGGRGIRICDEWLNDVGAFIEWMGENLGPRPAGHSIDRIDNDGDYEPGNVRWATATEQNRNQRAKKPRAPRQFCLRGHDLDVHGGVRPSGARWCKTCVKAWERANREKRNRQRWELNHRDEART